MAFFACGFADRDSPQDSLAVLCASMSSTVLMLSNAVDDIITSINSMNTRAVTAISRCTADNDALLSALVHARARVLREYCARSRAYDKWLDERVEEADTVSKQLAAVSAMCAALNMRASTLLYVGHISALAQSMNGDCARLCVPVSAMAPSALAGMSTVWRELPDGAVSTVSGRGRKSFVKGAAGATRNVVLVYPRVFSGALAEYVTPDDVCLMLRDDAGTLIDARVAVERVDDGGLKLVYAVAADCVIRLSARLTVCGVAVGPAVTVQSGYRYDAFIVTKHVASYDAGQATAP